MFRCGDGALRLLLQLFFALPQCIRRFFERLGDRAKLEIWRIDSLRIELVSFAHRCEGAANLRERSRDTHEQCRGRENECDENEAVDAVRRDHDLAPLRGVDEPGVDVRAIGHLVEIGNGASGFVRRLFVARNRLLRLQRSLGADEPVGRRLRHRRHRFRHLRARSEHRLQLADERLVFLSGSFHFSQCRRIASAHKSSTQEVRVHLIQHVLGRRPRTLLLETLIFQPIEKVSANGERRGEAEENDDGDDLQRVADRARLSAAVVSPSRGERSAECEDRRCEQERGGEVGDPPHEHFVRVEERSRCVLHDEKISGDRAEAGIQDIAEEEKDEQRLHVA